MERRMAQPAVATETKAVEGSFERLRDGLRAAIFASGQFNGGFEITNTLPDRVTIRVYGREMYMGDPAGQRSRGWQIPYSVGAGGAITLGTAEPIVIEENITAVSQGNPTEAVAAEATGGEYSDDDVAGKADGGLFYKAIDFEVKSVSETELNGVKGWTAEGYVTEWNVVDREGDVTIPGCFDRWLREQGLPVAKYEHGGTVGKYLSAAGDAYGFLMKAFVPEDPATELLHKLMKIGAVAKMSIGWRPYPGGMAKRADGVRELREIMLPEASFVAIPMHPGAQVTSVKSGALPDAKFDERIEAATAALNTAVADAGALVSRRTAQDRAPSAKSLDAVAALAVASGDAMVTLVSVETKAGRALSGVRKRHLADLMKAMGAILASLPEGERKEIEALVDDGAGEGEGGKAAPNTSDAAGAARRREAELFELKLLRYARQAPVPDSLGVTP
ncbi:MAG: HK97 family phage prohead protease [Ardenticatenales bacterium]